MQENYSVEKNEEEIGKIVKEWDGDPSDLEGYMEVIDRLQRKARLKDDPEEYGKDLLISFLMEGFLKNADEYNYVPKEKFEECLENIGRLVKERDETELPGSYKQFFESFKETISGPSKYFMTARVDEYDGLPMGLSDCRGDIVTPGSTSKYMVDIDSFLLDSETLSSVKEKLFDEIDKIEDETEKFCFIEKRRGHVGAIQLSSMVTDEYDDKESIIYRSGHLGTHAKIDGQIDIGEEICLVDDLSFTGKELKRTARRIKDIYGGTPRNAVVIVDMDEGAEEELKEFGGDNWDGVKLRPLYQIDEDVVEEAIEEQYEKLTETTEELYELGD